MNSKILLASSVLLGASLAVSPVQASDDDDLWLLYGLTGIVLYERGHHDHGYYGHEHHEHEHHDHGYYGHEQHEHHGHGHKSKQRLYRGDWD